jgi:hypothetical protein
LATIDWPARADPKNSRTRQRMPSFSMGQLTAHPLISKRTRCKLGLVDDRLRHVLRKGQTGVTQFLAQARLVRRFQQPRPELPADLNSQPKTGLTGTANPMAGRRLPQCRMRTWTPSTSAMETSTAMGLRHVFRRSTSRAVDSAQTHYPRHAESREGDAAPACAISLGDGWALRFRSAGSRMHVDQFAA